VKLKTKLVIAFLFVIFIPLFLFGFCAVLLNNYQSKALQQAYGIQDGIEILYGSSIQIFDSITQSIEETLIDWSEQNPDYLLNPDFEEEVNIQLQEEYSFFAVCEGKKIVYWGSEDKTLDAVKEKLFSYSDIQDEETHFYTGRKTQCLVKQIPVRFSDGKKGAVFIITPLTNSLPEIKQIITQLMALMIICLVTAALFLTFWIYRSLISPIHKLQVATREISQGNLDFVIDAEEHDEIGQLCEDFEEMRQRMKQSNEEKLRYDLESKELISNISHDLKTPITSIKGYVEGIMDGVASSPEKLDKYIRTIYNKANDMDRLINELTFYTKIDTNRIPYNFMQINLADYFEDCVEELRMDLEAKQMHLDYKNEADSDVVVIADAEQLKRVINNIVGNSVKYMDKAIGIIRIHISDLGDFVQIDIADNGAGIPAKDLPRIFERFYRTDASRNSVKGGSGIGLSIVRKIIEDHNGRIWATSEEQKGTTMHFVLRKYQEVRKVKDE
jgi:signal transduction histidine kinase